MFLSGLLLHHNLPNHTFFPLSNFSLPQLSSILTFFTHSEAHIRLYAISVEPPVPDVFLREGEPLPLPPRGGSGPRPAAAPAGESSAGAGCRAGWPAPPPGCRVRTGGGCRRMRSAASWGGSAAVLPAAGPWRNKRGRGSTCLIQNKSLLMSRAAGAALCLAGVLFLVGRFREVGVKL